MLCLLLRRVPLGQDDLLLLVAAGFVVSLVWADLLIPVAAGLVKHLEQAEDIVRVVPVVVRLLASTLLSLDRPGCLGTRCSCFLAIHRKASTPVVVGALYPCMEAV